MDKHLDLCERITKSLDYFSFKVTSQVLDYFYDNELDCVVIYLKEGSDRVIFCQLLDATGLFKDTDEMRVLFKHK